MVDRFAACKVVARAQPRRKGEVLQSLFVHSTIAVGRTQDHVGKRKVRIELERLVEFFDRRHVTARDHVDIARGQMRPRILPILLDGQARHRKRRAQLLRRIRAAKMSAGGIGPGKQAVGARIAGVDLGGPFQQRQHDLVVVRGPRPDVRHRTNDATPGIEAFGRPFLNAQVLGGEDLRLDRGNDFLGYLVLHLEDVGNGAIIAFSPDMRAGRGVDELARYAQAFAGLADTSLEHIANPEVAGDLAHVAVTVPCRRTSNSGRSRRTSEVSTVR